MRFSVFLNFTLHGLVVCWRHSGISYQSHLRESSGPKYFLECLTLQNGTKWLLEMSVTNY